MSEIEDIKAALGRIEQTQQEMKLDLQRVVDDLKARPSPAEMQVLIHEHRTQQATLCRAPSMTRAILADAVASVLGNGTILLLGWMLYVYVHNHP